MFGQLSIDLPSLQGSVAFRNVRPKGTSGIKEETSGLAKV